MWHDQLKLKGGDGYFQLFWEIYKQERSSEDHHKIAVQIRKEELLKEHAIDLISADAIRYAINARLYHLQKKASDIKNGLQYALDYNITLDTDLYRCLEERPLAALPKEEQLQLLALRAKLEKTDAQLIEEEIQHIRHQPRKTDQEYISLAENTKKERFKKWGATAFRGIGAAIGAAVGGIAGTLLFPGIGSGAGMVIGASVGSIIGLVTFGIAINAIIVNHLIPLGKAYHQAFQVKKLRKKRTHGLALNPLSRSPYSQQNNSCPKVARQEVTLAKQMENIYKQVKDFIRMYEAYFSYTEIQELHKRIFISANMPLERKLFFLATIENTLGNHYQKKHGVETYDLNQFMAQGNATYEHSNRVKPSKKTGKTADNGISLISEKNRAKDRPRTYLKC